MLSSVVAHSRSTVTPVGGRYRQNCRVSKLMDTRRTIANGSGAAKAIDYALKRWEAL
jgi:hypothetical protein